MLRLSRPVSQALRATAVAVHPHPLPQHANTYSATLDALARIPPAAAYRQSVLAVLGPRIGALNRALAHAAAASPSAAAPKEAAVAALQDELGEEHISVALRSAQDELGLARDMADWKPYVLLLLRRRRRALA
jgi:hypothetical protein